ncbi:MAG: hypothetical protein Q8P63_00680 [Candidatus Nealsonbacteria bacterium]|nr:hypothetical protein [Candidatus Nealsonbacteria bacterium]
MELNLDSIISLLLSSDLQEELFAMKVFFFGISMAMLISLIFFILKTHYMQWLFMQDYWEFSTFRPFGAKRINRIWNKVLKRLETGLESDYKTAVIEADNMLDNSLKRMGYLGQTLEERLGKMTSTTLPNLEDIYSVHKMRNSIMQEPTFRLTLDEARWAISVYEKAFNVLQILT